MKAYKVSVSHSIKTKAGTKRFLRALLDRATTTGGKLTAAIKHTDKPLSEALGSVSSS